MLEVMLDLETLGNNSNAPILSIGAVAFDPYTPSPFWDGMFYTVVDVDDRDMADANVSSIKWWMTQSDSARAVFSEPGQPLGAALTAFSMWFRELPHEVNGVWGNGSDFDNVILDNACRRANIDLPWSHRQNRCFRTLKSFGLPKEFVKPERQGTHHNALDDAVYQAQYMRAVVAALKLRL